VSGAPERSQQPAAQYHFGDGARPGVMLGLSLRQAAPLVAGAVWLTLALMAGSAAVGLVGVAVAAVVSFGRWRGNPLYEVAIPGGRLSVRRLRHRTAWSRRSLLGTGNADLDHVPEPMVGLELHATDTEWTGSTMTVGVVRDRSAGTASLIVHVLGDGFAVAGAHEQDQRLAAWGAALAPLARDRCPVARITWQEWAHTVGVTPHRDFLRSVPTGRESSAAAHDYDDLLTMLDASTVAHDVLITLTVDIRRLQRRRGRKVWELAVEALVAEAAQLAARLGSAGLVVSPPLCPVELSTAVRLRSDPHRAPTSVATSLAAAVGRGSEEWGPMAVDADWNHVRVDDSFHRSYRVVGWPMLPVCAEWMAPLMVGGGQTRTVTIVLEPVPIVQAAREANRQLTSLETDHDEKSRKGFRSTARERRRIDDVEARERELAAGHPEFRHVGFVTVTAGTADELDGACAAVEQDAAQSLLDIRPLAARQGEGWVASLPLGRSVRRGMWS
jgi:hypothetical protein